MTRDQLIGTWRCKQTRSVYDLRPDCRCVIRTKAPNGKTYEEHGEWEHVDTTHWKLSVTIAPNPQIPSLENGAVEVIDYEIISEQPKQMSLMQFDVEFPWVWVREARLAGSTKTAMDRSGVAGPKRRKSSRRRAGR